MLLGLWLGQPRSCGYSALKGPPASLALDAEDTSTVSQPFVSTLSGFLLKKIEHVLIFQGSSEFASVLLIACAPSERPL